jgi:hypothetical protein
MKSPEMFFSHSLVANVYRLLETYRFSLAARRFVYGLIDGSAHTPGYWQSMYGDDHLPLPCASHALPAFFFFIRLSAVTGTLPAALRQRERKRMAC